MPDQQEHSTVHSPEHIPWTVYTVRGQLSPADGPTRDIVGRGMAEACSRARLNPADVTLVRGRQATPADLADVGDIADAWLDTEIVGQLDAALGGRSGPADERVTVTRGILAQARDRIVRDEPRNGRAPAEPATTSERRHDAHRRMAIAFHAAGLDDSGPDDTWAYANIAADVALQMVDGRDPGEPAEPAEPAPAALTAEDLANLAVAAERARIRAALRHQMDNVVDDYRRGYDDTPRMRAYMLGRINEIGDASGMLGDGIAPITPGFDAQAMCDRLGV